MYGEDEVNLVTCILAKKHGIKYTAVRIRDMQFLTGAKDYLKKNFDIDLVINPEMITAREINRILLTPAALNVEDFANGKVRLFETKITRHSPLVNVPFKNMNMPPSVLVGMIFRDQRMIILTGTTASIRTIMPILSAMPRPLKNSVRILCPAISKPSNGSSSSVPAGRAASWPHAG